MGIQRGWGGAEWRRNRIRCRPWRPPRRSACTSRRSSADRRRTRRAYRPGDPCRPCGTWGIKLIGRHLTSKAISGRSAMAFCRRRLPIKHHGQTVSEITSICMESRAEASHFNICGGHLIGVRDNLDRGDAGRLELRRYRDRQQASITTMPGGGGGATNSTVRVRLLSAGNDMQARIFQPPLCTAPLTCTVIRPFFCVAIRLSIL